MIDWDSDLVDDLARRKSVLFVGAGVSRNATNDKGERPADWVTFLKNAAAVIATKAPDSAADIAACIANRDLLTACELVRKTLHPDRYKTLVLNEYSDKGFKPAEIHQHLLRIDSRYVVTTNFDRLYENAAHQFDPTVIVKSYYDSDVADVLRRRQRVVLKMHGTVDFAERTIFTRSDYAKARVQHAQFYNVIEAMLITHTFVFLGASMTDPDMQMILENHAYRFPGGRPHFIVMPIGGVSPQILSVMESSMNLRSILYDPADNHRLLSDSLGGLVSLVEEARGELISTLDW